MPSITLALDDTLHQRLVEEHKRMSIEWLRSHPETMPPDFNAWLIVRLATNVPQPARSERELDEMRMVNAIEKLITELAPHRFGLVHLGKTGEELADAVTELGQTLIAELGLSRSRTKRIQDLLAYYAKSPKEVADLGHVGVTNRAYGALHEAYRELAVRTEKARGRLGEEKALGRLEGAVAMLVSAGVMSRESAREKTEAFRLAGNREQ
ncbi:hypothetical protein [Noviherbaspirillum aerium]|uniref:hypothetical protein n=1 Tax=Noviherbaspirillum aerium TaxID=2588497 RepID=UPI00124EDE8F|nr:hypothetical protein [Noviherbaspirillum aerium]